MNTILGFCCVNRQKDDLTERYSQANNPYDYLISTRPNLPRVLSMFCEIETHFRLGLKKLNLSLEDLVGELDKECIQYEADDILCKFIPREAVNRIFDICESEAPVLYQCLRMQFFKEDSQDMYDFNKLVLFLILYCEAEMSTKA